MNESLKIEEGPKSARVRFNRFFRAKNKKTTKVRSHYCYKIWIYDPHGNRTAVATKWGRFADLISTCYYNPATRTYTVHCLAFDLDFDKADDKWKMDGKLSWPLIKSHLKEYDPKIAEAITAVSLSSSERGLGIAISISPLEMLDENFRAKNSAFSLQNHIIRIFRGYGMGADPSAAGLQRDFPNYHNPDKLIEINEIRKARVDNRRIEVVSELLKYTNSHPFIRYLKKSERDDLLWPDARVELKLARLYCEMFDNHLTGSEDYSLSRLREITGLSKDALYNFLKNPPAWIKIERLNKYEGYRLSLNLELSLYERAGSLLFKNPGSIDHPSVANGSFIPSLALIKAPSEVEDGERNEYLTKAALTLKHGGVDKPEADLIMDSLAAAIPGAKSSRNCRGVASIVRSIYYHKPQLFGVRGSHIVPAWLLVKHQAEVEEIEFPESFKKGKTVGLSLCLGSGTCSEMKNSSCGCLDGELEGKALCGGDPDLGKISFTAPIEITSSSKTPASDAKVIDFIKSFLPNIASELCSRNRDQLSTVKLQGPTEQTQVSSPTSLLERDGDMPQSLELIYGGLFDQASDPSTEDAPQLSDGVPWQKRFSTLYEKNLANFSERHPLDRFQNAFHRLYGRYSPKAIHERLINVQGEIIAAGHKEKYRGIANKYLPPRDPFRRIVAAFLLMSFSMQHEVLKILFD